MDQTRITEQLRLAMSILSGRRNQQSPIPRELTPQERDLLGIDERTDTPEMLLAAEEIVSEIVLAALGMAQDRRTPPPDPRLLAAMLLDEIDRAGGELPITQVHLPPDFLNELWREGVVQRRGTMIVWGKNARRALDDVESLMASAAKEQQS